MLAFAAAVLGTPATAVAGDDEPHAPPSAGPPGPWNDGGGGEGEDVPYKPTDARRCRLGSTRKAGPGTVLGAWVVGARCGTGKRIVRRYQRCLNSKAGRKRRCYGRVERRCVFPTFLGRCWMRDRFFHRRVSGYACVERRAHELDDLYDATVLCRKGRRRVTHR